MSSSIFPQWDAPLSPNPSFLDPKYEFHRTPPMYIPGGSAGPAHIMRSAPHVYKFQVRVENIDDSTVYQEIEGTDVKVFLKIQEALISSQQNNWPVSVFKATLMTVRSNNLRNFAKDFFFPTVFNQAVNIQNTTKRIFAILFSLALDVLTFPIRLVTYIPRIKKNAQLKEKDLSIKTELISAGINTEFFKNKESIQVKIEAVRKDDSKLLHGMQIRVNFIPMPFYRNKNHDYFTTKSKSLKDKLAD